MIVIPPWHVAKRIVSHHSSVRRQFIVSLPFNRIVQAVLLGGERRVGEGVRTWAQIRIHLERLGFVFLKAIDF